MKKSLLLVAILIVISSALCANPTSTTASMQVSAYKDQAIDPTITSVFTIKYYDGSEITGVTQSKDISSLFSDDSTNIAGAFEITIESNNKATIEIGLSFQPFVSQNNSEDKTPLQYRMTSTTTKTAGDTRIRVNTSNVVVSSGGTWYCYAYTPSLTLAGTNVSGGNTVTVPVSGTSATLTYKPDGSVYRTTSNTTNVNKITSSTTMPTNNSSNKLPGFNTKQLSSKATFELLLDSTDYSNMRYFVDYVATVAITITMD